MYIRLHQFILSLLFVCCLPSMGSAQSLKDRIAECYTYLIDNQDLTLDIEVKAWKLGKEDRPIDETAFTYTHDQEGFYMKMLDMEVIQSKNLTIKVDHITKEVLLLQGNEAANSPDDLGLPTWLAGMENIDSVYSVEVIQKKNGEVYTLTENGQKAMEITLKGNQITKLMQYPVQPVRYQGKTITTVVEMSYNYQPARKRLRLNEVLNQARGDIELKGAYARYKLVDYRQVEIPNQK